MDIKTRGGLIHRCDDECRCPIHPDLPLLYAPATGEHACQKIDCVHGHGMRSATFPWVRSYMESAESAAHNERG